MSPEERKELASRLSLADFVELSREVLEAAYPGMTRATTVVDIAGKKAGAILPILLPDGESLSP